MAESRNNPKTMRVMQDGNYGGLRRALRLTDDEKWERMLPLLERRVLRWTQTPQALLVALRKFARVPPPPPSDLVASVCRTALNGWCTTSRFQAEIENCRFCGLARSNAQPHYLSCAVMRRWLQERLGCHAQPSDEESTAWMLLAIGDDSHRAMRMAAALDCALYAFDARRSGSAASARQLLDARLKELCRRNMRVRAAVRTSPIG